MIGKFVLVLVLVASFVVIEASAQQQIHHLTVKAVPNIIFIGGSGDYTEGTSVTLKAVPLQWQDYVFIGWKVDGRWSLENPPIIRMDKAHTVQAFYEKSNIVGGVIVDTIPRITDITVDGQIYLANELPLSFNWEINSDHVISIPSIVKEDPNSRYKFDSWKDKNQQSFRTIIIDSDDNEFIALYKTQYFLKSVSKIGSVIGDGWYEAGTGVNFEIESDVVYDEKNANIRYHFDSWNIGDYLDSPENYIDLINPVTLKSNWKTKYQLTITSSVPDYEVAGSGWYFKDRNVILFAEREIDSQNSDVKYVFERWVTTGTKPLIIPNAHSPSTSITLDNPYSVKALYGESFRVNVWTPFSGAQGGGFHEDGKVAEIKLSQTEVIIEPNKIRKVFTGWDAGKARVMDFNAAADLDPEGKPIGKHNLLLFVDRPVNVTASWKTQYFLDVQTDEGIVSGSGWYDVGKMARIQVKTPTVSEDLWSATVFDKWSGDNEGTALKERILINEPKTVVAEWKEDKSPGLINGLILAGLAATGIIVYSKTHTKISMGKKHVQDLIDDTRPFEKFFNLRKRKPNMNQHPSFYQKPKKKKAVINWLLGKE